MDSHIQEIAKLRNNISSAEDGPNDFLSPDAGDSSNVTKRSPQTLEVTVPTFEFGVADHRAPKRAQKT